MSSVVDGSSLTEQYRSIREFTERLAAPLSPEDCMLQTMDDVSPTRWHLAHTTWFFETFVLADEPGYQRFDDQFHFLFNSYYNTLGPQFPRGSRGLISRPGLERIKQYRKYVDHQLLECLQREEFVERNAKLIEIGLHHEQQHQELILTDIKHVLACNPTWPSYHQALLDRCSAQTLVQPRSIAIDEGLYEIGHCGGGFAFDNESPRHKVFLQACDIAGDLVTCGEYLEFIEDGGYQRPEFWLSLGWSSVHEFGWQAPSYWHYIDGRWMEFTLVGLIPLELRAPVTHVSFFEADAYARWRGARLPTEFEWEVAAMQVPRAEDEPFADYLLDRHLALHPRRSPQGLCGGVWQWTASSYVGYPGYQAPPGAVGEYNGKFMCDQHVLRGGSVATHSSHIRPSYRNFFPATSRWQFSGMRLVR